MGVLACNLTVLTAGKLQTRELLHPAHMLQDIHAPYSRTAQEGFFARQLLGTGVITLKEVLDGIEHNHVFEKHGITEVAATGIYLLALPQLVEMRQATGPEGLKSLDLRAVQHFAWRNYFRKFAASKAPLTQVQALTQQMGFGGLGFGVV